MSPAHLWLLNTQMYMHKVLDSLKTLTAQAANSGAWCASGGSLPVARAPKHIPAPTLLIPAIFLPLSPLSLLSFFPLLFFIFLLLFSSPTLALGEQLLPTLLGNLQTRAENDHLTSKDQFGSTRNQSKTESCT